MFDFPAPISPANTTTYILYNEFIAYSCRRILKKGCPVVGTKLSDSKLNFNSLNLNGIIQIL